METKRTLSEEQLADSRRLKNLWDTRFYGEITQEEVAHRCGWKTQGAFNQYLNGKIPIGLPALLKISRALGVEPYEISPTLALEIRKDGSSEGVSAAQSEIDLLLANATPSSRRQLLAIARALAEGRLSDADIKMLSYIAKRMEKGMADHRDDYPNLKPD